MKPAGYPLPWHDVLDVPYYQVNSVFGVFVRGWSSYQAKRGMQELIPAIDRMLDRFPKLRDRVARWMAGCDWAELRGEA